MATKKKASEDVSEEENITPVEAEDASTVENTVSENTTSEVENTVETTTQKQKYEIGSIVFLTKDVSADLNGFKLFPQYKKYTYTVEAYDADTQVYTLRRLNLTLKLKENYLVAPSERAHDSLNRKQF